MCRERLVLLVPPVVLEPLVCRECLVSAELLVSPVSREREYVLQNALINVHQGKSSSWGFL